MDNINIPDEVFAVLNAIGAYGKQDEIDLLAQRNQYVKKGQVILLGDSITAQFPINELYPNHDILNRGISGDTTQNILNRLESTVITAMPRKVILLCGTNDLDNQKAISKEDTVRNIQKICDELVSKVPNVEVYVLSILHINKKIKREDFDHVANRTNEDIDWVNNELKQIQNATYLDIYQCFIDENGDFDKSLTLDGLHFNIHGYMKYLKVLEPYLN